MGWYDDQGDIALGLAANREAYDRLDAAQRAAYAGTLGEPAFKNGRVTGVFKANSGALPFGGRGYFLESASGKTVVTLREGGGLPPRGGHHGWYLVEAEVPGGYRVTNSKRKVAGPAEIVSAEPAPEWRDTPLSEE